MNCPLCEGDCDAILVALRKSLGLPPVCLLCGATDSQEVKVHQLGAETYCYQCARELVS